MLLQVFHGECLADDDVGLEVYAHLAQVFYLHVDNLVGQAEFGYAILQHTANLMKGLEDVDVVAQLGHVACKAQT